MEKTINTFCLDIDLKENQKRAFTTYWEYGQDTDANYLTEAQYMSIPDTLEGKRLSRRDKYELVSNYLEIADKGLSDQVSADNTILKIGLDKEMNPVKSLLKNTDVGYDEIDRSFSEGEKKAKDFLIEKGISYKVHGDDLNDFVSYRQISGMYDDAVDTVKHASPMACEVAIFNRELEFYIDLKVDMCNDKLEEDSAKLGMENDFKVLRTKEVLLLSTEKRQEYFDKLTNRHTIIKNRIKPSNPIPFTRYEKAHLEELQKGIDNYMTANSVMAAKYLMETSLNGKKGVALDASEIKSLMGSFERKNGERILDKTMVRSILEKTVSRTYKTQKRLNKQKGIAL